MLGPREVISLGTTKLYEKESYLSWSELDLKNELLNHQKSEKTNACNLELDKKIENLIFQKKNVLAQQKAFFSGYNQKMHEADFFRFIRVRFEKLVSGVQKK